MNSNRRRFLGAAGVAAVASLTGCLKAAVRLVPAGIRGGSEAAEELDDENNDPGVDPAETNVTWDPDSDDSGDSDTPSWDGPECTDVTITNFNWEEYMTPGGEDTFTANLLNESEYAGTVTVRLEFYESEAERSRQGTIEREFAFGAQERIDMMISANPPTSESEWVAISVVDQDC